jgi:hypothetical protein
MQQAPYANIYKIKYLGQPKYVLVVNQCTIEKALVDYFDLSLDHVYFQHL